MYKPPNRYRVSRCWTIDSKVDAVIQAQAKLEGKPVSWFVQGVLEDWARRSGVFAPDDQRELQEA